MSAKNAKVPLPFPKGVDLSKLQGMLGPDSPTIEPSTVGKYRLHSSLRNQYGANYKNHPTAKVAIREFEQATEHMKKLHRISKGKE